MTPNEKAGWVNTLVELYDAAKARKGGQSLAVYSEVSALVNELEADEWNPATIMGGQKYE